MKLINITTIVLCILILSTHILSKKHKSKRSKFHFKKIKVEMKTCEAGAWKFFLGGFFYNFATDQIQQMFPGQDVERCTDQLVRTIYNMVTNYRDSESETVIKRCLNGICYITKGMGTVAKGTFNLAYKGVSAAGGALYNTLPEISYDTKFNIRLVLGLDIDDVSKNVSYTADQMHDAIEHSYTSLKQFWDEKASPVVKEVIHFIESFNLSDIINSLNTCVGPEVVGKFATQMGLRLLDYTEDGWMKTIGQVSLKGAEYSLNAYGALMKNPVTNVVLDGLSFLAEFTPCGLANLPPPVLSPEQKRLTVKNRLFIIGRSAMNKAATFGRFAGQLLKFWNPEIGRLIYETARNIQDILKETDDCLLAGYYGKLLYKIIRIAAKVWYGPGFEGPLNAFAKKAEAAAVKYDLGSERSQEILFDHGNQFLFG